MKIKYRLGVMPGPWPAGPAFEQCTAFGPADLLLERLDQYAAGGGSKFIARPMCPPDMLLDQIARLDAEVVGPFHRR